MYHRHINSWDGSWHLSSYRIIGKDIIGRKTKAKGMVMGISIASLVKDGIVEGSVDKGGNAEVLIWTKCEVVPGYEGNWIFC